MHSKGYVHADIKGANILLGIGKSGAEQCYLVDFGLANHYSKTNEYKPDPKNAHNGTIEYTSRDAHNGVSTMRGDFEVLGLNLVHWLGLDLPWETQKLLADPKKVQAAKEAYMKGLDKQLSGAPEAIRLFMRYVERMGHADQPDYDKCRGYLEKGLKACGKENKGALDFEVKAPTSTTASATTPKKRFRNNSSSTSPPEGLLVRMRSSGRKNRFRSASSSDEDEEEEVKESPKKRKVSTKRVSPVKVKKVATTPVIANTSKDDSSVIILDSPVDTPAMEEVRKKVKERRNGQLTVNNDITPKTTTTTRTGATTGTTTKKAKKTYEFNFELDVSIDADVVVNVKRKGRPPAAAAGGGSKNSTPLATPRNRVLASESTTNTPSSGSPMDSPVVRKRIARNVKVTPSGTVRVEKG